jgi:flagellar M-ring protein FliF
MDSQTGSPLTEPGRASPAGSGWLGRLQALSLAARIGIIAGVVLLGAAIVWSVQGNSAAREQRVLFSNVSGAEGAAIIAALEQMNVPYQFTEGGTAITVPKSVVYETRLKLAGQGLPKSGNIGFEILENQKFGTSQFVERVNYLRGLEGELARSIASIAQVKSARVHLAVPKQTSFTREQERPSASVLVTLHPGRVLDPSQTAAIARLVSSSVPGMQVQDVALLDTDGGNLVSTQPRADLDAGQLKYTKEVEASLSRRLADLLTPLAGPDGFRAQVTVELNFDEREKTSEVFSRNAGDQSIRSEQTSQSQGQAGGPGGLPGALSNQPPVPPEAPIVNQANGRSSAAPPATPAIPGNAGPARELTAPGRVETGQSLASGGPLRNDRTVNYEVDRSIERLKLSKGQIRRISAAVVLDYKPAASPGAPRVAYAPDELRQINTLIRDAVGYVQTRGDTVSLANLPFNAPPVTESAPPAGDALAGIDWWGLGLKGLLALLAVLILSYLLMRPRAPRAVVAAPSMPQAPTPAEQTRREIEEKQEAWARQREIWEADERLREQEAQLRRQREESAQADRRRQLDELVEYANTYAQEQPEQAALLLKSWAADKAPSPSPSGPDARALAS